MTFVGAGFGFVIICVFDFIQFGWNLWSIKRLEPVAALAASVLALVWRYHRYSRYKQAIRYAVPPEYRANEEQQSVWPPPPRSPD